MTAPKRQAAGDETSQDSNVCTRRPSLSTQADTPPQKRTKAVTVSSVVTRSASRKSTIAAVFLTTELLENILQFLPMKDLLLAQRVSRNWKDVITKSNSLQQMLFFTHKQTDFLWEFDAASRQRWPTRVHRDHKLPRESADHRLLKNGQVNPLVFAVDQDPPYKSRTYTYEACVAMGAGAIMGLQGCHQRNAMSFPEASWRRMLFIQPPIKSFTWEGEAHTLDGVSNGTLSRQHDLTCADVVSAIGDLYDPEDMWMSIANVGMLCPVEGDLAMMLAEQGLLVCQTEQDQRHELYAHHRRFV